MTQIGWRGRSEAARTLIVLVGFAWGLNWIATRILLQSLPPLTIRSLAVALGALVLFAAAAFKGDRLVIPRGERTKVAIAGFFNVTVFNAFSVYSQVFGSTSRAVVIAYSMPIWTFLLGRLVLKEKASAAKLAGLGLCAVGLGILLFPASAHAHALAALFALGCAWSWAAGTVYQKRARLMVPLLCSTAWQLLLGAVVLGAGMFALDGVPHLEEVRGSAAALLIYSGVVAMGLAYFVWFIALGELPTATAAIGTLLVPVIGVVASIIINGERPSWGDAAGFALILVAAASVLLEPAQARVESQSRTA
jgi:drug/metabolite transporter (DMT)-like permease